MEMRGKERLQVGFTLDLYAALPTDAAPGPERTEESYRILQRLRSIAQSCAPEDAGEARVEIEPPRTAAYLRAENEMKPEIGLRARIFHREGYFTAVTTGERDRLSAVEKKLTTLGLRSGHW